MFLLTFGVDALAQTPDCKAILDAAARLACYDKAAPPAAGTPSPKAPADPSRSWVDPNTYMTR